MEVILNLMITILHIVKKQCELLINFPFSLKKNYINIINNKFKKNYFNINCFYNFK